MTPALITLRCPHWVAAARRRATSGVGQRRLVRQGCWARQQGCRASPAGGRGDRVRLRPRLHRRLAPTALGRWRPRQRGRRRSCGASPTTAWMYSRALRGRRSTILVSPAGTPPRMSSLTTRRKSCPNGGGAITLMTSCSALPVTGGPWASQDRSDRRRTSRLPKAWRQRRRRSRRSNVGEQRAGGVCWKWWRGTARGPLTNAKGLPGQTCWCSHIRRPLHTSAAGPGPDEPAHRRRQRQRPAVGN